METLSRTHRIIILWILLVLGYILHSVYQLSGTLFGINIKLPNANGTVPPVAHLFRIVLDTGTIIIILLWLKSQPRILVWFSLVWSLILFILNALHWVETLSTEMHNYSQVALLFIILIVNGFLTGELWLKIWDKNNNDHAA